MGAPEASTILDVWQSGNWLQRRILDEAMRTHVFSVIRQNMSRVFAIDFGKRRCEQLGTGGHTTVETIPYPLVFDNGF